MTGAIQRLPDRRVKRFHQPFGLRTPSRAFLDDREFIERVYQAILLREPSAAEMGQYLPLLQNGAISKPWIIEYLLGLQEFRAFERRLRVIWEGEVITEPGRPEAAAMPAVTWPWRSSA